MKDIDASIAQMIGGDTAAINEEVSRAFDVSTTNPSDTATINDVEEESSANNVNISDVSAAATNGNIHEETAIPISSSTAEIDEKSSAHNATVTSTSDGSGTVGINEELSAYNAAIISCSNATKTIKEESNVYGVAITSSSDVAETNEMEEESKAYNAMENEMDTEVREDDVCKASEEGAIDNEVVDNKALTEDSTHSDESIAQDFDSSDNELREELAVIKETHLPPRTRNEIPPTEVTPITVTLTESDEIVQFAEIENIMPGVLVLQSQRNSAAVSEGSVICFENREILGVIDEVFGPTKHPRYTVRFNDANKTTNFEIGSTVYFASKYTTFVFANSLISKGSDASAEHDEEPPEGELEYSDDEEEIKAKAMLKRRNTDVESSEVRPKKNKWKKRRSRQEEPSTEYTPLQRSTYLQGENTRQSLNYPPMHEHERQYQEIQHTIQRLQQQQMQIRYQLQQQPQMQPQQQPQQQHQQQHVQLQPHQQTSYYQHYSYGYPPQYSQAAQIQMMPTSPYSSANVVQSYATISNTQQYQQVDAHLTPAHFAARQPQPNGNTFPAFFSTPPPLPDPRS